MIIFLEHMNLIGLVLIIVGIGILTFIPHFLAIQLIWKNLIRPPSKTSRRYYLLGCLISISIIVYANFLFIESAKQIALQKPNNFKQLKPTFMNEKILGMDFIYHTMFCEYDGWRPPKHEPLLILGLWGSKFHDYNFSTGAQSLDEQIEIYQSVFPDNKIKFDCSCAKTYSKSYHNDKRWEKHMPNKELC
tara:strand:- start:26 stop:595 length:570 start_codon:yes stop_codon:yes gene_type:complete